MFRIVSISRGLMELVPPPSEMSMSEAAADWGIRKPTKSTRTEKLRNRTMLRAKEPVSRSRFFLAETAWRMPSEVSIRITGEKTGWRMAFPSSGPPETAAAGGTFEARPAGAPAAIRTVTTPTRAPLTIPVTLTPNRGMWENSSPTRKRRAAHRIQVVTIPSARPMGTAVLHQFRASSRTKRLTCCRLIPMQRIMPKNCVLCATLLLMLPEIIRTPAARIIRHSAAAVTRSVCPMALSNTSGRDRPPCF